MLNKFEKNNKKLYETRAEVRTEMDQSMEKIQRLFNTMQEKIDEKWEKNYVEFDCKMVERTEQRVDDVEGKTQIVNKMIMNYREGEYRNFQEPQDGIYEELLRNKGRMSDEE
ncbi:hypothetical protein FQA39_LY07116 [Lamprigera yunnana]|nr:hypothetical protein FQA39_LY07116 [Lamprigera yunnana]